MLSKCYILILTSVVSLISLAHNTKAQNENVLNPLTLQAMQFIVEYANWRRLDHIIVFDPVLKTGRIPNNLKQLLNCLSQQGIYTSLYSTNVQFSKDIFRVSRHRLGVAVLLSCNESVDINHVITKASKDFLFDEHHAWLLITCGPQEKDWAMEQMLTINLGLTTDLVLAVTLQNDIESTMMSESENYTCPLEFPRKIYITYRFNENQSVQEQSYYDSSEFFNPRLTLRTKNNFVSFLSGYQSDERIKNTRYTRSIFSEPLHFELIQIYKIRRDDNSSLVLKPLGFWSTSFHFYNVTPFSPVEGRQDFLGFPLIVGIKNWTNILENTIYQGNKSKVDDTKNLQEIMDFIAKSLNATVKYVPFQALNTKVQEGVWSDLLNAVVKGEIDVGLEKVTITYHKLEHMAFTHNIMKMSHNIYMHPSEFSVSKDIYLTPFSSKLLLCVLGMAILLTLIMLIVSAVANYRAKKSHKNLEDINVSFAALWVVGILSMQGSVWSPMSSSGNMTLISSLMFSVVIYNSYAAFITSILSVKTSDINSLEDLFANGYKVGYIENSEDEVYLQSRTDELRNIFIRGFDSKVENIEQGLLLAAKTKYALFVSTQAARRAIQELTPYECRCQIQEFVLRSTIDDVAFPLNKSSPYQKFINLGVLRMIESGSLDKIQEYMLPDLPTCSSDSSFVSAQLEDVLTAVKLLLAGIILAVVIGISECVIKHRKKLKTNIKKGCFLMGVKIKHSIENFEF